MKIVLIRHGKVNFKWESWYNSEQFTKACSQYDQAPVMKTACSAPDMAYSGYYISTLPRTRETALSVFGEQEYIATDLINEVPLSASCNTGLRLPLLFWNVTGRLQWFFNSGNQKENRAQTEVRAKKFVKLLVEKNEDCAVVTHGFFMHTLVHELKSANFDIDKKSLAYANGEHIVASKKDR